MSTLALTRSDFSDKFANIQSYITPAALDLINRSETLKEAVRRYQDDDKTADAVLDTSKEPNAATHRPRREGNGNEDFITVGKDTLGNSIDLVRVLSHELGHHAVEGIDGIVTNGRNLAAAGRNFDALVDSCLLSEGYAALATARVAKELLDRGLTGADQF